MEQRFNYQPEFNYMSIDNSIFLVYAYLQATLMFKNPFNDEKISFSSLNDEQTEVNGFGFGPYELEEAREQVEVLS